MKAFISYSHADADVLDELHKHLAGLRRQKLLETWTDREVDAGGILDEEIAAAMQEARLFLFLISAAFINSDYCFEKEFQRALERHKNREVLVVPIIIRECDWKIPELKKFKALPQDGKPVISKHWHSQDEAFADVAAGLRALLEKRKKASFVSDSSYVTLEQRDELNKVHHEIIDRLTAKKSHLDAVEFRREYGKWAKKVWNQFHKEFETQENGLQSLPAEQFEKARQWLVHYRASKDSSLRQTKPQQFRNTLTRAIYSAGKGMRWSKEEIYAFAQNAIGYSTPILSLNDLGNNQLEKIRDKIRYEASKRRVKKAQSKAKKAPVFQQPTDELAKEILDLVRSHGVPEERGLTEILRDSPTGPLHRHFIPNTTARGGSYTAKKSQFATAVAELLRLGWLLQPESDHAVRIYEFNPKATPAAR